MQRNLPYQKQQTPLEIKEILLNIFRYLIPEDVIQASRVNHFFHQTVHISQISQRLWEYKLYIH